MGAAAETTATICPDGGGDDCDGNDDGGDDCDGNNDGGDDCNGNDNGNDNIVGDGARQEQEQHMASPATACHGGQATMGTSTTMTTVSPTLEGDGEHMVPLGSDGEASERPNNGRRQKNPNENRTGRGAGQGEGRSAAGEI